MKLDPFVVESSVSTCDTLKVGASTLKDADVALKIVDLDNI
jgi:hypothetical protein